MRFGFIKTAGAAACAALAMASVSTSANAANLLVNGGFEDTGTAVIQWWGGYSYGCNVADCEPVLPGWTIESGSVDIAPNSSQWAPAYEGSHSLDINGYENGRISQAFATDLGVTYWVNFAFTRNAAGAADPATADVIVSVGNQTFNVSVPNDPNRFGTSGNFLWETASFSFVGTGNLETLTLASTGDNSAGGVFFDAVSVAVPEPATWALMIGGFGIAGASLRARRRATAA